MADNDLISQDAIRTIFEIFQKNNPEPKTELYYINNYTMLVAVVLSAQSTDIGVNKVTKDKGLFEICASAQETMDFGLENFRERISSIGLYNNKSKNILALSEILVEKHGGVVPDNMDDLVELPGVGRKSASVVLSVAFGKIAMPVDTHVSRVSQRMGLINSRTPDKIEKDLLSGVIPVEYLQHAHHWIVLHGRYVCKARKPQCSECPIKAQCRYYYFIKK